MAISTDRQFANNLSRGMEVLRAFSARTPVLSNRDLSDRTGLPKATVSRLTYTLCLMGYLKQADDGRYQLGIGVLSLAHPLLASLENRRLARPVLQELSEASGCTVNLAALDRTNAVHIDTVRSDLVNPYLPDVGSVSPLLRSAIGRALLLAHTANERSRLLNQLKIYDAAQYAECLEFLAPDEALFRAKGYCRARGPWLSDIDAIAVPVPLGRGRDPLAVNCTISLRGRPGFDLDSRAPLAIAAGERIQRLLKY